MVGTVPSGVSAVRGLLATVRGKVQGTLQFDWTPFLPNMSARTVTGMVSKSRLYLHAACYDQATTNHAVGKDSLLSEVDEARQVLS